MSNVVKPQHTAMLAGSLVCPRKVVWQKQLHGIFTLRLWSHHQSPAWCKGKLLLQAELPFEWPVVKPIPFPPIPRADEVPNLCYKNWSQDQPYAVVSKPLLNNNRLKLVALPSLLLHLGWEEQLCVTHSKQFFLHWMHWRASISLADLRERPCIALERWFSGPAAMLMPRTRRHRRSRMTVLKHCIFCSAARSTWCILVAVIAQWHKSLLVPAAQSSRPELLPWRCSWRRGLLAVYHWLLWLPSRGDTFWQFNPAILETKSDVATCWYAGIAAYNCALLMQCYPAS